MRAIQDNVAVRIQLRRDDEDIFRMITLFDKEEGGVGADVTTRVTAWLVIAGRVSVWCNTPSCLGRQAASKRLMKYASLSQIASVSQGTRRHKQHSDVLPRGTFAPSTLLL